MRLIKRIRAFFFRPKDRVAAIADYLYDEILYKASSDGMDDTTYEFGRILFTGWKAAQGTSVLVGQLLFYPPECTPIDKQRYFYVNLPGMQGGEYRKGDCFDISLPYNSEFPPVTWKTDPVTLEKIIKAGTRKLIDLVCLAQIGWLEELAQRR